MSWCWGGELSWVGPVGLDWDETVEAWRHGRGGWVERWNRCGLMIRVILEDDRDGFPSLARRLCL